MLSRRPANSLLNSAGSWRTRATNRAIAATQPTRNTKIEIPAASLLNKLSATTSIFVFSAGSADEEVVALVDASVVVEVVDSVGFEVVAAVEVVEVVVVVVVVVAVVVEVVVVVAVVVGSSASGSSGQMTRLAGSPASGSRSWEAAKATPTAATTTSHLQGIMWSEERWRDRAPENCQRIARESPVNRDVHGK